jgi:deoxyribodipyrimidine photo-lyase
VLDLKERYKRLGSDLLIKIGKSEDVLDALDADVVVCGREVCEDERALERKVKRKAKGELKLVWDNTLYHYEDVFESGNCYQNGLNDLPTQFTQFKNKVESKVSVRKPILNDAELSDGLKKFSSPSNVSEEEMQFVPTIEDIPISDDARQMHAAIPKDSSITPVYSFKGGESEALKRVQRYLYETDAVATYFDTRNGMLEDLESTKLAPYLALGCISPRFIENEIRKYEKERVENKSTYWVIFELTWRDFYRFFALRHGAKIFKLDGIGSNGKMPPWTAEHEGRDEIFEKWISGTTGYPLIDANMRELKLTGWMSNRGRQNVASWLALDARIDWRMGAEWFEFLLLDYDPASNWGNWVAAAGLTRGRVNKFNIPKQTKDYDPQMKYCRKFIPELDSKDYPRPVQLKKFAFEESSSSRNNGGRNGPNGRGTPNGKGGRRGKQNRQPRNNAFYDDDRQNGGGGFS